MLDEKTVEIASYWLVQPPYRQSQSYVVVHLPFTLLAPVSTFAPMLHSILIVQGC